MKKQKFLSLFKSLILFGNISIMVYLSGCTSVMRVSEVDLASDDETKTSGIILNKRTQYTVSVKPVLESIFCEPVKVKKEDGSVKETCKSDKKKISNAVSVDKMLSVNAKRLPFASSTLTIDTSTNYTAKKIGITDVTSGTSRAVDAATTIIDSKTKRLQLRLEAQQAEAESQ